MRDILTLIGTAIACILGGFVILLLLSWAIVSFETAHPCIKSHVETQTQLPAYYQPGQDGGIAIPIGNVRQVQVVVCDERK